MISCHRAVHSRYSCHAPRARIPCNKYHAGHMREPSRAHDQSDRFLELLRARTSSSTSQHHRNHLPHRQMVISIVNVFAIIGAVVVRVVVLLNIAAVGAIFIIVADLVDVILSSRMSEQRHRAYLHQRLMQTIIGIEDAIIDVVIGRVAFLRIMSFARQVASGRVGCLRQRGNWRLQFLSTQL